MPRVLLDRWQDVIARRTRLAFIDYEAATAALPRVVALLSKVPVPPWNSALSIDRQELHWSGARQTAELAQASAFLQTMSPHPPT